MKKFKQFLEEYTLNQNTAIRVPRSEPLTTNIDTSIQDKTKKYMPRKPKSETLQNITPKQPKDSTVLPTSSTKEISPSTLETASEQ